jgi:hypothetical protein
VVCELDQVLDAPMHGFVRSSSANSLRFCHSIEATISLLDMVEGPVRKSNDVKDFTHCIMAMSTESESSHFEVIADVTIAHYWPDRSPTRTEQ